MCWLQVKLKAALFSQRNMAKEIDEHNYRTLLTLVKCSALNTVQGAIYRDESFV